MCSIFNECISEINNTQADNAKDIDVVMPMYNLIEYRDNFRKHMKPYRSTTEINQLKTLLMLFLIFPVIVFRLNSNKKIIGQAGAGGTNDVEILLVLLKYLSNFWRTLEMSLINCGTNLILTTSANCVISSSEANGATAFVADPKLYDPVVTLSTLDDAKLLQQLKLGFTRAINWNKYLLKVTRE